MFSVLAVLFYAIILWTTYYPSIVLDRPYVEIKNPFNNAVMFDGNMPRSKQENHGYGTRSMAAIVTKYDGVYSFTIEDGDFVFRCGM